MKVRKSIWVAAITTLILSVAVVSYLAGQKYQIRLNQKTENERFNTLEKQISDIKNTPNSFSEDISNINAKVDAQVTKEKSTDLSSIISEWTPVTARITCSWKNSLGVYYQSDQGSGLAIKMKNGDTNLLTNAHVIEDDYLNYPSQCSAYFPSHKSIVFSSSFYASSSADYGFLYLSQSDPYLSSISIPRAKTCKTASVGDQIVILGYPTIGSKTDVTATEGIISGYDGQYYITSAKIDHGNSGGVAVLVKDNCYLGIPSAAVTGSIESLGRILDVNVIN